MTLSIKPLNQMIEVQEAERIRDVTLRLSRCIEIQSSLVMFIALPAWGQLMPEMMAVCPIASSDFVDPPNQAVVGPWGNRRVPHVL